MIPTLIGLAVLAIGFGLLLSASTTAMLLFVLGTTLMLGSAAVTLTALGNVSIQPSLVATGFLFLRCVLPNRRPERLMGASLADNGWLVLLVAWSLVGAYTLPFLFANTIDLVPLRPSNNPLGLVTSPLRFSPQNITTSAYMGVTLLGALCSHAASRHPLAGGRIARMASVIALSHAAIGWGALLLKNTPARALFDFFRNGSYMQLDQSFDGFGRLTGIAPEPSLYASYGLIWFVFVTELWLRSVDRRWSGPAALILFLTLIGSTSSTAYVGLAVYSFVILLRQIFLAGTIPAAKGAVILACIATLVAAALALIVGSDEVARAAARILRLTTSEKLSSESGVARLYWAQQGLGAFVHSWGLGVGVGSFRSSSILTAVLGSSGLIGFVALFGYLIHAFRPMAGATWIRTGHMDSDVASAAGWAIVMALAPACVSAPSPDPGLVWGLLAGMSLGLRRGPQVLVPSRRGQTSAIPVLLWREAPRTTG